MLAGLTIPDLALLMLCGVALDYAFGETPRWHPLVGFGKVAACIERHANRGAGRIGRGIAAWMLAVLPVTALAYAACDMAGAALHVLLLYVCLGLRSLRDHNLPIACALARGDVALARRLTSRIVSRDTSQATEADLAKASTESLLENGNDAVFGTLFWFVIAGGPGAVLYRLANTLDAMWGYRSSRYLHFGRAAARLDDALNFIPARLTALSYVLLANDRRTAWRCWREQARAWPSPNGGPVMASGAGGLGVALGGAAVYDGITEQRPPLGKGRAAGGHDIARAWELVQSAALLWLAIACAAGLTMYLVGARHA
ncbi:adenosylcobinamide-phosphate synthase CbiB [Massilia sp. PAMC28688]|uniref:adenosylcobinamide-phosphate synthase CbiB n=1 Tax=Massilia sp. PAMC28688 TaxID=2861283 RepID=UPI001C62D466|nr:adenosylcobinamide-phosphate synthase CbiB [Massilia sp. PAMC28688]QYF94597.1 adenosylcobinamide-phosphate synthase CbiB [Massilia sp. PAMC28688]